ncbi:hypothetical protein V3C99_007359 [Haemonchus contortus]
MSSQRLLFFSVVTFWCILLPVDSQQPISLLPWLDSFIRLPLLSYGTGAEVDNRLKEIRDILRPLFKQTASKTKQEGGNSTKVSSGNEIGHGKPLPAFATVPSDMATTIPTSIDAELEHYTQRLSNVSAELLAEYQAQKLEKVPDVKAAARKVCYAGAKGLLTRAKCMVKLLEAELKFQREKNAGTAKTSEKKRKNSKKKSSSLPQNNVIRKSRHSKLLFNYQPGVITIRKPEFVHEGHVARGRSFQKALPLKEEDIPKSTSPTSVRESIGSIR